MKKKKIFSTISIFAVLIVMFLLIGIISNTNFAYAYAAEQVTYTNSPVITVLTHGLESNACIDIIIEKALQ